MLDMAPKEKHKITHNLYEQLVEHQTSMPIGIQHRRSTKSIYADAVFVARQGF